MLKSTKPGKCLHCKVRLTLSESAECKSIHLSCIEPWTVKRKVKEVAGWKAKRDKLTRVERASVKVRKSAMLRIPDLIKLAQTAFNAFIRARDANQPCICCGQPLSAGDVGGRFDCGHYRSTGSASHLRYTEDNAHGQRKFCNRYGAGRAVDYRLGLIARIGTERVLALESSNEIHKWTRDELIDMRAHYTAALKALKAAV